MSPPPSERYVKRLELAKLMGVSVSSVKRMDREGMPSETWGMARTRRYLPSEAIAWALARGKVSDVNRPGRRANAIPGLTTGESPDG